MAPTLLVALALMPLVQAAEILAPLPEVPFVPTPVEVVDEMLRVAEVGPNDRVYDLGCGDGRVVIRAAQKHGARAVGVDLDGALLTQARERAASAGVGDRVEFRQQDLFTTDLRDATVVTLYLLPEVNLRLLPKLLAELRPGARIVSHDFDMGSWKPEQSVTVQKRKVYLWTVPADPAERRELAAQAR
jgi:SAM-dependent methyltransferase